MIASGQLKMDAMDLGKKSAVEKELEVTRAEPNLTEPYFCRTMGAHEPLVDAVLAKGSWDVMFVSGDTTHEAAEKKLLFTWK